MEEVSAERWQNGHVLKKEIEPGMRLDAGEFI